MAESPKTPVLEDDAKEKEVLLIEHRLPWLILGLFGGILATVFSASFEDLLAQNIQLAFFIPIIVYMADAIGTQTQTVYVRNMGKRREIFHKYIFKELLLGLLLGFLFGAITGLFSYIWFQSFETSLTIGMAMFLTMATAPVLGIVIPELIRKFHKDPAVGAGPFTTVLQDLLSLLIYFTIATIILFR